MDNCYIENHKDDLFDIVKLSNDLREKDCFLSGFIGVNKDGAFIIKFSSCENYFVGGNDND